MVLCAAEHNGALIRMSSRKGWKGGFPTTISSDYYPYQPLCKNPEGQGQAKHKCLGLIMFPAISESQKSVVAQSEDIQRYAWARSTEIKKSPTTEMTL